MDARPVNSPRAHFVDIREVPPEEEAEQVTTTAATNADNRPDSNKRTNRAAKLRDSRRQQRTLSRQVSLETGFSVLNREKTNNNYSNGGGGERKVLSRSGLSFGGFDSAMKGAGGGTEGVMRKADFSLFRTKSTLSKQNSLMKSRKERETVASAVHEYTQRNEGFAGNREDESVNRSVPAGRYFAALRGPELDEVKDYEDILLPKDQTWPFLLRFPIGCFGICLGLSSQAVLWRSLATSPATQFLHISPFINLSLWLLALAVLFSVTVTYLLKSIFYFEAVRREYFHPVRINFFFAPWVVCMFLAISAPPSLFTEPLHPAIWCTFMAPYFFLELKIYGQWLSGGKRRLCKVANPSSHLSVVGNFVGAILAAKVGWKEAAKFFWAVGFAHYLVVFVTLYQRLPTSEALPKELHPVYSMFIAAPSAASIAWDAIYGEFDGLSRTCYFIALFLYVSLVVRINFFTGFRFSVAWWSYTFPMTTASVATIKYAEHVPCTVSKGLALTLSFTSSTMVALLFVSTLLHAFVWRTLFPNDLAIAITKKRQGSKEKKPVKRAYDIRRWAKQSSLPFVSSIRKQSSGSKDENEAE
ncbi:guard cell S-type anion channel SLAC1 [Syzygium oleosum]|uniref:guard cell S-type anion channel SLAC1 n=1 Tax=Syzygium oleosum TaxID=219896 RepID=UPI0011D259A9|nr:guard cell S-type anion channel SLAC1 [Syzygium oleosum]